MNKSDCFYLGSITKLHGYGGEVVFFLDVDNPDNYKKMKSVLVEINKDLVPFFVEGINVRGTNAIVKLEDVNSIEQATELLRAELYLPLSNLPPLKGKRFYFHEVIGFQVIDETEGPLGEIQKILDMPQQAVVEMLYKEKEVLFPITDEIIIGLDREAKKLFVKLPEGLLEVYL